MYYVMGLLTATDKSIIKADIVWQKLENKISLLNIGMWRINLSSSGLWLEKICDRMEVGCGKANEKGGQHGRDKAYNEQEECHSLKGHWSKVKKLWKLLVELAKKLKVIMIFDHHCSEDDKGTFSIEEKQRNSIVLQHSFLVFGWN